MWEIRSDDIAGCLRTARGGSSRQALVEAGHGELRVRWMTPREYARLQGAPEHFDYSAVTESRRSTASATPCASLPSSGSPATPSSRARQPSAQPLHDAAKTGTDFDAPVHGGPPVSGGPRLVMTSGEPVEVSHLYAGVERLLNTADSTGRRVGDCKHGVYLFIDYDEEPIYVGQTREKLRTRIRRHLTNQRTDAVAMRVLDPFEVAEVEMWPFWDLTEVPDNEARDILNRAEFTVFRQAVETSRFGAVLNEGEIPAASPIELPESVRGPILTVRSREQREHPDIRLARRARTTADLARVISERRVKRGIRHTLWVQARRLEHLARSRLDEFDDGD